MQKLNDGTKFWWAMQRMRHSKFDWISTICWDPRKTSTFKTWPRSTFFALVVFRPGKVRTRTSSSHVGLSYLHPPQGHPRGGSAIMSLYQYRVTHQVVPKLSIQGQCKSHSSPESRVWEQTDVSPGITFNFNADFVNQDSMNINFIQLELTCGIP